LQLLEVPSAAAGSAVKPAEAKQKDESQPDAKRQQVQPQEAAPQPTPQEQQQKAQKATAAKKMHQAQDFNKLVKNVNTILDSAILQMKRDRKLFRKAQSDEDQKEHHIAEAAEQAKQEAKDDATRIAAIETHVSLAQQENAKVMIQFAAKFRRMATRKFWKRYNKAKKLKSQLSELYDSITSHVGRAVQSMRRKRQPLEKGYDKDLRSYYKVRYTRCTKSAKASCTKVRKTAKTKMKAAYADLLSFKTNLKTAHRHGKRLRRRLHSAIQKLHFVFKQARQEQRKGTAAFHAGFDARYSARKTISLTALKKVKQRMEKQKEVQPQGKAESPAKHVSNDAMTSAAKAIVTQAAKAIAKEKVERAGPKSAVAAKTEQPVAASSMKKESKVEITAEKQVVSLLKKVVKQATTTILKQQAAPATEEVPPKVAPSE